MCVYIYIYIHVYHYFILYILKHVLAGLSHHDGEADTREVASMETQE